MDYLTLLKAAERGEVPALALLHGGDAQLLDDALAAVTRALFVPDEIQSAARCGGDRGDGRQLVRPPPLPFMTARRLWPCAAARPSRQER